MMQGNQLSATAAAEAIREGSITAGQLVQSCLDRISEFEPDIGAWAHLDAGLALEQARQADQLHSHGRPTGPLHGVPVGIKDIIDTASLPTEYGTALCTGRTPSTDASLIGTLREAGAIILGKTVTTELAVYAPGKTRNPHNPAHTPGGSSSGSAAAVAAYMTPLAVGTQTNGSVIRPASFCGVFGFKPSYGRISRYGVLKQSHALDTVGVFARDLGDLALIADTLMVYDARDRAMRPQARPYIGQVMATPPPVEPRIAFVRTPVWERADDATKEAFKELIEHIGSPVDVVDLAAEFDTALEHQRIIMEADLAKNFSRYHRDGADQLSEKLCEMIESGQRILATDYNNAIERIEIYTLLLNSILEDYDAILTPSAAGEAPGIRTTGDPAFCTLWTLCGMPALNLPLFQGSGGLPVGAQLVAARGDDARLFRTARWLLRQIEE